MVYLFGSSFTPDESTYGLVMAHILNGKPWPVFFYAQPYTGTQSAILAAFLAKAFGFWPYFLKLIPLVASVGLIWANYFLAKLIYKGKRQEWVGLTAALLTALLPSFAQNWGVRAGSGYPEVVLVGSLCLILGVGVLRAKPVTRAQHAAPLQWLVSIEGRFFVLGLLAGFGYWVQPAIVYYLLPLAFLIFLWEPKFFLKRWFHLALLGVIIGAAPVIWFNIQNDLYTGRALFAKPGGIKNAFLIFFTEGMPVILGTRASWSRVDHFLPLAVVVWVAYGVAFFVPAWDLLKRVAFLRQAGQAFHRVKGVKEVFLKDARVLLLLVVLVTPFIFAISPFNWFVVEPRYIYAPLYSTLPVLLGGLLLVEIPKHRSYKSYMTYVLLVLVLASNLLSMTAPSRNSRPDSFETQTNLTPVIEFLRERNVHYVYSSFMFCHRLVFESQEDVICTPFEGGFGEVRYPQYKEMVVNAPKEERGFVFLVRGGGEQETADNYTPALESCKEDTSQQNDPCHEQIIGPFRVSWYR
ncbi:MAG: hypothetical protein ABH814_03940 [bacterium]